MTAFPANVRQSRSSPGRRLAATVVAAAVVVAGAAALLELRGGGRATGGAPVAAEIDLLPSPGTRSSCIVGTPGAPRPVLPLDLGVFQANTYSVPTGTTGQVGMCYEAGPGSLLAYVNWTHVGGTGGWFSYPQVTYGVNSWDGLRSTYTNQSLAWALPQTVAEVADEGLWTTVNYSFHPPAPTDASGYDFSLDDFFTERLPPVFEDGPFVEVMVWFAHDVSYPAHYVRWSAPTLVNSTVTVEPWDVGYWCHGADNGSNANVSFDYAYDGPGSRGLDSGTVGVNLSRILADVESLMPSVSCWTGPTADFAGFHLDEANLGSEDDAVAGASYNYSWTVSGYCFHSEVQDPSAGRLNCRSAGPESPRPYGAGSTPASRSAGTEWSMARRAGRLRAGPGNRDPSLRSGRAPRRSRRGPAGVGTRLPAGSGGSRRAGAAV